MTTDPNGLVGELEANVCQAVLGKPEAVRLCVVALLAGEHILLEDVPATGDPFDALSKAFLHHSAQTSSKYDDKKEDKGKYLLHQVKTRGAEGVVFAEPSFCDPALIERPMLKEVLAKEKIT